MLRSVLVGLIMGMVVMLVGVDAAGPRPPERQLIQGVSFTIVPSYLDPSEARQVIYFALASGVGWIVPKQQIGQVSDEGFKQHPIGLGSQRFVRADPSVGLVLETYERYWRKTPAIHRLILKSVLDPTTRLAVLKMGELGLAGLPPDEAAAVGIRTQVWSLERGAAGRRTVGG